MAEAGKEEGVSTPIPNTHGRSYWSLGGMDGQWRQGHVRGFEAFSGQVVSWTQGRSSENGGKACRQSQHDSYAEADPEGNEVYDDHLTVAISEVQGHRVIVSNAG